VQVLEEVPEKREQRGYRQVPRPGQGQGQCEMSWGQPVSKRGLIEELQCGLLQTSQSEHRELSWKAACWDWIFEEVNDECND
jgi:hypothetical protein